MAENRFAPGSTGEQGPARDSEAVTPHATSPITPTRGIMVNSAGNIACRFADADADVTIAVAASVYYPFVLTHVRVTGTTATGIHAFY